MPFFKIFAIFIKKIIKNAEKKQQFPKFLKERDANALSELEKNQNFFLLKLMTNLNL